MLHNRATSIHGLDAVFNCQSYGVEVSVAAQFPVGSKRNRTEDMAGFALSNRGANGPWRNW